MSLAQTRDIENQRELFQSVFSTVELGDWSVVENLGGSDREALQRYVLWPDLLAAYLRANIRQGDGREIEAFLDQYGTLKPARDLRYRYALEQVRRGDLPAYFTIYQSYYQGLDVAKLDCLALQAEIEAGRSQQVVRRARDLWLVGKSQVEECDPVFAFLKEHNALSPRDYQQRYALAIEARDFSLARWLAKSIDDEHVAIAAAWQRARNNPTDFLAAGHGSTSTPFLREQLAYAAERLTYNDPLQAHELWQQASGRYAFTEEQKLKTARHIALWTARDNLPGAYSLLSKLPLAAQNQEVMRWRARSSLRSQNWARLLDDIRAMSAAEKAAEQWRYWRAVALKKSGQIIAAKEDFELLAAERGFYGFLAADELDATYPFEDTALRVDEAALATLAARPDLQRARELFLVGLDGRGRSEWDAAISYFNSAEKAQAAILAHRWGWHSRAIATAASVGEYDDLSLRYPLPYQSAFTQNASAAQIPATWAYGIARSESLFMRDIRSSAGAVGLMQLMPATGKMVAGDINLPYAGLDTLTNPLANIQLGTTYLGQMAERFGGNRVLATAAYNAGPHRVDRWMPAQGSMDARIWIENIPFNETRKYVRRVMAAETIFHWRLTGGVRRLSNELPAVEAASDGQDDSQQVASSN